MGRISRLLAAASALILLETSAQTLPYSPTSVFLSPAAPDLAYAFLPPSSSSSQTRLASLNISSSIQSSKLSLEILTSDLPFLDGGTTEQQIAYIPSISSSGSLGVYTGQCTNSSSFWIFTPSNDSAAQNVGAGNWREMSISASASVSAIALTSANFLASSFSFSTLVNSNDTQRTVYTFGGMCPTSVTSNSTTAQSTASYSNNMLKLSYSSPTSYDLSLSSNTGNNPIAEAGFTFTALTPTFSNSSDGIATQAQNLVMLGGHTSTAFINMSQVALFSLPQESWSFHSIDPTPSKGTELAIKSTSSDMVAPDSRSGHTAVLSADGSSLIVFGGWVGDTSQAAQPQLAILRTGSGFGGTGDWAWQLPASTGPGLSTEEGIYGHGAVLLPGNIMMVLGGYRIPAPSSSRLVKKADPSDQAMFLNTTSMTWISTYTNPGYSTSTSGSSGSSITSSSTSNAKQVGLGAGLGLGLAAVIGAICVYFWYARRLKRRRKESREKDMQDLSRGAADYYATQGPKVGMNQQQRNGWWSAYQSGEMSQRENLMPFTISTSSLGNRSMGAAPEAVHGPGAHNSNGSYANYDEQTLRLMLPRTNSNRGSASITRKPVNARNARGYYQQSPGSGSNQSHSGFDLVPGHTRANSLGTAGLIHPIYEADEDLDGHDTKLSAQDDNADASVGREIGVSETDPFVDPQHSINILAPRSNPGSRSGTAYEERSTSNPESSARERELEIKRWVADWAAADALMHSRAQSVAYTGRVSPSKESASGRTESSLSERSVTNTIGLSRNGSRAESSRNNSLTAFFSGGPSSWNPFVTVGTTSAGLGSIVEHRSGTISAMSDRASIHGHAYNGSNPPKSSSSTTSSSYATANTSQSLSALRAEGQSLLPQPQEEACLGSPSKRKAAAFSLRRRQSGWLGSLKRVFINVEEDGSLRSGSTRSSPTRGFRSPSLSNSPTRADYGLALGSDTFAPRRAVSATATMWRRKQGREDWQDSAEPGEQRRANTLTLEGSGSWRSRLGSNNGDGHVGATSQDEEKEEEEWDIERAIERRVVQVMFTVPKERLRVVNQDVLDESSEAGSLKLVEMDDGDGEEDEKATHCVPEEEVETLLVLPVEQEKELERELELEHELERETESAGTRTGSPVSSKGKGRVQEMVDKLEGWRD